jgi:hypothetical protein
MINIFQMTKHINWLIQDNRNVITVSTLNEIFISKVLKFKNFDS